MDRELHGHPASAIGYSGFSLAGNFGMQGYESQELYSLQGTSAVDFHRSFEEQLPSIVSSPQQNLFFNDGKLFSAQTAVSGSQRLKLSKYLFPAQELLNEFCDLGGFMRSSKQKSQSGGRLEERGAASSASLLDHSLKSLHTLELQKRKANLLSMLEEVDRRYKRYCEQMRAVVSSFEAVAGQGAATVYLALASKAMSRHFRSLRDGIVGQMQAARKAMAERDPSASAAGGISRGETPRLKLLDQYCSRQHKAFQQGGGMFVMDKQQWRPQRGLPERSVSILRAWLFEHFLHPYPSDVEKHILARQTGLSRNQVTNWFINARVRLWKPMIEEIYLEEMKEDEINPTQQDNRNPCVESCFSPDPEEQKPPPSDQLLAEPDSLSSIINADRRHQSLHNYQNQLHRTEHFGAAPDFDFSSYSGGNGVSLTLGLQHHNGGGGGAGFSLSPPPNHQQFGMIDGEVPKLTYRNLMGAQLLHDWA